MEKTLAAAIAAAGMIMAATTASGGEADVLSAEVAVEPGGTVRFSVTVSHSDEGWNHYADRWEVLTEGGQVLGIRTLHHPHAEEQPFIRSLSGVRVPDGIGRARIRARDSVREYGGAEVTLALP